MLNSGLSMKGAIHINTAYKVCVSDGRRSDGSYGESYTRRALMLFLISCATGLQGTVI